MATGIYQPPGPVSEALAYYYVRHVVQREIDRAFTLADPGVSEQSARRATGSGSGKAA